MEEEIIREMRRRGRQPNVSWFAFTATPKTKTLELFGKRQPDGSYVPFSLYTMRQAIEEGFILDVLENYMTFKVYFSLFKKIEDDPPLPTPNWRNYMFSAGCSCANSLPPGTGCR